MFCTNCGKEIPDDSNFCQHCGFNVEVVLIPPSIDTVATEEPKKEMFTKLTPAPPFEFKKFFSGYKKFFSGLIVICILFLIISIIFSFNK